MMKTLKPKYKDASSSTEEFERKVNGKRRKRKVDDSHKYYWSYVLCYVDDIS